jgi:lysophospholipase L1-like esterase
MNNTILLIGSSIIKKWTNSPMINKKTIVLNKGMSGYITKDLISPEYLKTIFLIKESNPLYIIIYCGSNDIRKYTSNNLDIDYNLLDISVYNITIFIDLLKKMFKKSTIILISVIKSPIMHELNKIKNINYFNKKLLEYSNIEKKIIYVDVNKNLNNKIKYFKEDKLHLDEDGYKIMNKIIENIIKI